MRGPALTQQQSSRHSELVRLVGRYEPRIRAYLRPRVMRPEDAEDLVQEVFLRYLANGSRVEAAEPLPWLIGIARNVLREHARRVRRRREIVWTELCLELDALNSSEVRHDGDEALDHLPACLETLGPSARQALDLHYRSGRKVRQVAELIRRSEGATKLLMFRARQTLRQCLEHKAAQSQRN